jgi:hypothetical protein
MCRVLDKGNHAKTANAETANSASYRRRGERQDCGSQRDDAARRATAVGNSLDCRGAHSMAGNSMQLAANCRWYAPMVH